MPTNLVGLTGTLQSKKNHIQSYRLKPHGRFIMKPMARSVSRSKGYRSQQSLQTTNPLLTRSLSESSNFAWYWVVPVLRQGISHVHTINVVHLT